MLVALLCACHAPPPAALPAPPPAERCGHALQYLLRDFHELEVTRVSTDGSGGRAELDFRARERRLSAWAFGRLACMASADDPSQVVAVTLNGDPLSDTELALVRTELLLWELRQDGSRLQAEKP